MNTPDNNEKSKQAKKIPTEIEYREPGQWKVDENVLTVMGGLPGEEKRPIGFVKLIRYDENKKPELAALDLEGNEIFERSSNLYQLKKQFRDSEERLTKALLIREAQPEKTSEIKPEIPAEQKGKELKKVRRTKADKSKENEQIISH